MQTQTLMNAPIRTVKWYQKGLAMLAMFCSIFMFTAFSGSYANTMDWVDLQLGKTEMRSSEGLRWLNAAIGSGVEVSAQLAVVDVANQAWQAAQNALLQALSGLLSSILNTVGQIFQTLISKIQEMSNVFASLGNQAGNIMLAIQTSVWPQIEDRFSSLGLVDGILDAGVPNNVRQTIADSVARLRFVEAAKETDPSAPAQNLPTQKQVQQAKADIATATTQACGNSQESWPYSGIMGYYKTCAATLESKVAEAKAQDTATVKEAVTNLQNRAAADCKQPFVDLSNVSFGQAGSGLNLGGIQSRTADTFLNSDFLNGVYSFSSSAKLEVLTPDECRSLQASADAALAGTAVTPPASSAADGLSGVIQTFIDTIVNLVNQLINSVINIALNAINAVFNAFPRVFSEGFSQLVGNFSTVIQSNLAGIGSNLIVSKSDQKDFEALRTAMLLNANNVNGSTRNINQHV